MGFGLHSLCRCYALGDTAKNRVIANWPFQYSSTLPAVGWSYVVLRSLSIGTDEEPGPDVGAIPPDTVGVGAIPPEAVGVGAIPPEAVGVGAIPRP